jgi:hypothetical protein
MDGKTSEIDKFLQEVRTAIQNAGDIPEVGPPLAARGMDAAELANGWSLLGRATDLVQRQKAERGDVDIALDAQETAYLELRDPYREDLEVLREILGDEPGAHTALGLSGRRKQSYPGIAGDARLTYTNLLANESWLQKVSRFGLTREHCEAQLGRLAAFETAIRRVTDESNEAREVTAARGQALDELAAWFSRFKTMARIALKGNPGLLGRLGIVN